MWFRIWIFKYSDKHRQYLRSSKLPRCDNILSPFLDTFRMEHGEISQKGPWRWIPESSLSSLGQGKIANPIPHKRTDCSREGFAQWVILFMESWKKSPLANIDTSKTMVGWMKYIKRRSGMTKWPWMMMTLRVLWVDRQNKNESTKEEGWTNRLNLVYCLCSPIFTPPLFLWCDSHEDWSVAQKRGGVEKRKTETMRCSAAEFGSIDISEKQREKKKKRYFWCKRAGTHRTRRIRCPNCFTLAHPHLSLRQRQSTVITGQAALSSWITYSSFFFCSI